MEINYDILLEFKNITSFDMVSFFQNALTFLNGDYNTIVAYYSGNITSISSNPFNNFKLLKQQRDSALETINANRQKLTNLKWFLLVEHVEDIDSRLNTLDNINKWSRSSITFVGYDPSFTFSYRLKQKQTLENVAQTVLNSNDPDDDWADIALSNYLREEDYSPAGGVNMNLTLNRAAGFNFKIQSVVAVIQGKSVYGLDLDRHFGFDTANNDLKVLDNDCTIRQAVHILIKLKQNDISYATSLGLQQAVILGVSKALLNFPVITRQLSNTFASDDSLKDFTVNNYSIDQDNVTVNYQVNSRLGEVIAIETENIT